MFDRIKDMWHDTRSQIRCVTKTSEDIKEELEEKLMLNTPAGDKLKKFIKSLMEREKRKIQK